MHRVNNFRLTDVTRFSGRINRSGRRINVHSGSKNVTHRGKSGGEGFCYFACMLMTTEIQADLVGGGSVTLVPDWLRVPLAVKYSGISRAKLYTYLGTGEIKSFVLKKKGAMRGTRFVSRISIDSFLNAKAEASAKRETAV